MSYLKSIDVKCPKCQFPNSVELWSIINVKEDPKLKDLILAGELNMVECTSCHEVFYGEEFVLYHEPDLELMAFIYPYDFREQADLYRQKTLDDFKRSQAEGGAKIALLYEPITLFGLDELIRILEREEEISVQSEIVSHLSRANHIAIHKLRPSMARAMELPWVIPYQSQNGVDRTAILSGIEKILDLNDRLHIYRETRDKIKENASFQLKFD